MTYKCKSLELVHDVLCRTPRFFNPRAVDRSPNQEGDGIIPLPGLMKLLNTFEETTTPVGRSTGITQTPIFTIQPAANPRKINWITFCADAYLEFLTGALGCLYFEPFFSGLQPLSKKTYVQTWLKSKGACTWFSDIYLTQHLRDLAPEGEFLFRDEPLSNPCIHPYRILNLRSRSTDAFSFYLKAFLNLKALDTDPSFRRAFAQFYELPISPALSQVGKLEKSGIFDEFFIRFCNRRGIPTLLNAPLEDQWESLCDRLLRLQSLNSGHLERVAERRRIQTRALFAFGLRDIVKPNSEKIQTYIDLLEKAMIHLPARTDLSFARDLRNKADKYYTKQIRPGLQKVRHEGWSDIYDLNGFKEKILKPFVIPNLDFVKKPRLTQQVLADLETSLSLLSSATTKKSQSKIRSILCNSLIAEPLTLDLKNISPQDHEFPNLFTNTGW